MGEMFNIYRGRGPRVFKPRVKGQLNDFNMKLLTSTNAKMSAHIVLGLRA